MVRIHLLGGVTVVADDGVPIDIGPAKNRAVLATLALSVGDAVQVSRLVDVVWGEDPPRTADKTLQGYVADLRKSLGHEAIVRTGAAYRLDVPPHVIDVHRFRRHVATGEVDAALAEWTGAPLVGLDAPGLAPIADGLVEQWLSAVETDLERRVSTDAPATVATLTQLTADHPFREGLWALLMVALYRSGRQADALAAYQRARTHLIDELGVEPGPRLRELEEQILEHDDGWRAQGRAPMQTSGQHPTGNLPGRVARLVGRGGDLEAVVDALDTAPVVTLVGPGGIGKTTLALAGAHRWQQDGMRRVWLVELSDVTASEDVPRLVAGTLGVTESAAGTLTDSVVAALSSRPTLLVLDNCEHVVDGAALLVRAVCDQAPDTPVLATSREPLQVADERLVAVGPLDPAGAGSELFAERARAASASLPLDNNQAEVAEICRRLDGVPLALELAAARTRTLTTSQLLVRLDDRLRLLTNRRRDTTDRHRTLRATVGWSYDLLTSAQQLAFQRLSVFTGLFDLAAAEAVVGSDDLDAVAVDELVADLVERSMVAVESGPLGRRFKLLETLRQFASEQLTARGGRDAVSRRHVRWCTDQVAAIGVLLTGPGEVEGVARLTELWPNLRTAVDWTCTHEDAALADALVRPIAPEVNLRRQAEIGDWAERILELLPSRDEDAVVFWLAWAGDRYAQASDADGYERLVERYGHTDHPLIRYTHAYLYSDGDLDEQRAAVAWLRDQGEGHAADLVEIAGVASGLMMARRFDELDALASTMVDRFRHGPPTLLYFALGLRGYAAQFEGRHGDAAEIYAQSAGIDVPAGTYLVNRTAEARAVFDRGEHARAFAMLRDHVAGILDTDYVDVTRMAAVEFVRMTAEVGHLATAARALAYLDTTGAFGVLARDTLVADAVRRIAADPAAIEDDSENLDDRQTLIYMRDALDELARSDSSG